MQVGNLKKIMIVLSVGCVAILLVTSSIHKRYFYLKLSTDTTPVLQNLYKNDVSGVNIDSIAEQLKEPRQIHVTNSSQNTMVVNPIHVVERPVQVTLPKDLGPSLSTAGSTSDNWRLVRQFDIMAGNQSNVTKPFACVNLIVNIVPPSPICIYDPKIDIWVSGSIQKHGAWEADLIRVAIRILKDHKDMDFLDIGCNIGVYTIPVAKFGRRVVSIDANRRNLRLLSKSLVLGRLEQNVTLIWNAVSNHVENVTFHEGVKNVGGTSMISARDTANVDDDHKAVAVTLNDMIPMFGQKPVLIKMDIERHELKAFEGADRFLNEINVPYVIMEWMHHGATTVGEGIINYMVGRSYRPFDPRKLPTLLDPVNKAKWPSDIVWIKDGAPNRTMS